MQPEKPTFQTHVLDDNYARWSLRITGSLCKAQKKDTSSLTIIKIILDILPASVSFLNKFLVQCYNEASVTVTGENWYIKKVDDELRERK